MKVKIKIKEQKDRERLETELTDIVLNNIKERIDEMLDSDKTFLTYLKKLQSKSIDPYQAGDKITKSILK